MEESTRRPEQPKMPRLSGVVCEIKVENCATNSKEENAEEIQRRRELRHFWVVIFGFFILMIESGVRQVLNVFTKFVQEEFGCSHTTAAIAIVVIPNAASLMCGPLVAIFYQMFGARVGIVVGGLLSAAGFICASLCASIYRMFFYTLLIGVGCGLMRNAIMSVQCEYFSAKRRSLVLSVICIGPGVAIFIFPRIILPIIHVFNWKTAWRFVALLYIICAVMGAFITRKPTKKTTTLVGMFGLRVWRSWSFLFHQLASFCASATAIVYVSHTLLWMRQQDVKEPEIVYTYNGIASILARICITLLLEMTDIHIGILMIISYGAGPLSMAAAGFCSTDLHFKIQNFMAGFGFGLYQGALGPYLVRLVGCSVLPNALGYTNLINGLAALTSVNVAGWLVHVFDSMTAEFVFVGVIALLSCVFAVCSYLLHLRCKHRANSLLDCPSAQCDLPIRRASSTPVKLAATTPEKDENGKESSEHLERAKAPLLEATSLVVPVAQPERLSDDSEPEYDEPYSP